MATHPPKNRKATCLGILEIKITSDAGTITTDPNGKAMMAVYGQYPIGGPIPGLVSEISGLPAYRIELDDIEIALSFEEMDRFFRHDLSATEYQFLLNKYGMFHEIHEDFYASSFFNKGKALQPIPLPKETILKNQNTSKLIKETMHTPKNRKTTRLGAIEIRLTSNIGTITIDPNRMVMMGANGDYDIGEPVQDLVSEISGKPAYRIELDDIELALSFQEMDRFFRRDLKDDEYKFLLNKYGMFHEIHEDFYWKGRAVQPIEIAKETILRIQSEGNIELNQPEALVKLKKTTKKTKK
jgi:hypothetical protein